MTGFDICLCDLPRVECRIHGPARFCEGVHDGMTETDYHTHPSLSSTGAKYFVRDGGPAQYRWDQQHPRPPKKAFDLGHAVHGLVLGVGEPVTVLDPNVHGVKADGTVADNPRATASWKKTEAAARARGHVPIHIDDWAVAQAMSTQLREHPVAATVLAEGKAEQSMIWRDHDTGVLLRCRPDWWRTGLVADVKTTNDASKSGFEKAVANFSYHLSAAMYLDGVKQTTGQDCAWLFLAVTTDGPHLAAVHEPDAEMLAEGHRLYRQAVETYARCLESDTWPGLSTGIQTITLPRWAYRTEETYA